VCSIAASLVPAFHQDAISTWGLQFSLSEGTFGARNIQQVPSWFNQLFLEVTRSSVLPVAASRSLTFTLFN
jgi:hypothetical protein